MVDRGWEWFLACQVNDQLRGVVHQHLAVVVVHSTNDYRHLARQLVHDKDEVVEIGSSLGKCTEILVSRASHVLGVDVSLEQLAISRKRVPNASFVFLDLFEEAAKLRGLLAEHGQRKTSVALLDIGGDRQCRQVLRAIHLLQEHLLELRLVAVKSEELYSRMAAWTGQKGLGDGYPLPSLTDFLCLAAPQDAPESAKAQLKKQRRARRVEALAENKALAEAKSACWFARRDLQAAQGQGLRCQRGICILRLGDVDLGSCLFLHHEQQPLFQALSVACLYCEDLEAKMLVDICRVPMPVFWGQGGGEVMQEFLGSYRCLEILPPEHGHYQEPQLLHFMEALKQRSRRPPSYVLLQMEPVEIERRYPQHPCDGDWHLELQRRLDEHL